MSCHDESATTLLHGVGIGKKCVRAYVVPTGHGSKAPRVFVASMTSPHDIPRLLNVAAIVTDQGDWLCHAAVIARELELACVVGTTEATAVLTAGQEIIVCSSSGQVLVSGVSA
jgi:phosphoenolpyruvate synthase/pyruvate phosphate dikinase